MPHPNSRYSEQRIDSLLSAAKANQALEGLHISVEVENIARDMLHGKITSDEARARILAQHGISVERMDAWAATALRRCAEIDSGQAELISGEEVNARIRKIVGR